MSAQIINHPNLQPLEPQMKTQTIELDVPPLGAVLSYRVVWALCTVSQKYLKATHFAVVLVQGREPIWGVWTVNGVFQRFFSRRSAIEEAYPRLVWRKKQSTWTLADVHDMDISEKSSTLQSIYKKNIKIDGTEMSQAGLKVIGRIK